MKKVAFIFIGFIGALWIYSLAVGDPPSGLRETPHTTAEITLSEVNKNR